MCEIVCFCVCVEWFLFLVVVCNTFSYKLHIRKQKYTFSISSWFVVVISFESILNENNFKLLVQIINDSILEWSFIQSDPWKLTNIMSITLSDSSNICMSSQKCAYRILLIFDLLCFLLLHKTFLIRSMQFAFVSPKKLSYFPFVMCLVRP